MVVQASIAGAMAQETSCVHPAMSEHHLEAGTSLGQSSSTLFPFLGLLMTSVIQLCTLVWELSNL